MNGKWTWALVIAMGVLLLGTSQVTGQQRVLLLPVAAVALSQEGYELAWWTVDGGGYTYSTGGGYELGGTAGQPDAGVLAGEGYTLGGGFWGGGAVSLPPYRIYLPLLLRQVP